MRVLLLLFLAVTVAVAGSGCSAFRSLFSDPGAEKRRTEKKRSRQSGDDDELQSRRYRRDPLDSLFFNDRNKTPSWAGSDLSDAERAALGNALDPDERSSKKAIDQVYLENERSRRKRTEWVFGPNPFRR